MSGSSRLSLCQHIAAKALSTGKDFPRILNSLGFARGGTKSGLEYLSKEHLRNVSLSRTPDALDCGHE
jgi:hypothetical protein